MSVPEWTSFTNPSSKGGDRCSSRVGWRMKGEIITVGESLLLFFSRFCFYFKKKFIKHVDLINRSEPTGM